MMKWGEAEEMALKAAKAKVDELERSKANVRKRNLSPLVELLRNCEFIDRGRDEDAAEWMSSRATDIRSALLPFAHDRRLLIIVKPHRMPVVELIQPHEVGAMCMTGVLRDQASHLNIGEGGKFDTETGQITIHCVEAPL